jgi:transposase
MKIVDTMAKAVVAKRPLRRQYSAQFKAEVVRECRRRGASVAGVALSHGINANIVHRWLREHVDTALVAQTPQQFVPVTLDEPAAPCHGANPESGQDIRVEVRRGNSAIVVTWPLQGASSCAAWLREWLN